MSIPEIGLIGLRHMGEEHYSNILEAVNDGKIVLKALCDVDDRNISMPEVNHSIPQIDLLLRNKEPLKLNHDQRLSLLHQKMLQLCENPPKLYRDYGEMLDKESLDGVIVCTPTHLHRDMTNHALSRDVNVLCEKPLAPSIEDCNAMIEAERKSAAFLQVGFLFRYRKLCRFVKQAIEDGKLGSLKMMWVQEFRGDWNPHGTKVESKDGNLKNWRYLNQQSGGSIVEKMCHDMDIFTWWADSRPRKVAASGGNAVYTDRETIDHTNIIIQYANDIELNLSLCLFAPNGRFTGRHIGLIGDGGTLDLPPKSTGCTIYRQNGEVEEYDNIDPSPRPGHHAGDASMLELDAFIDYIKSDEKPFASAEIGKMAVELSLAAEQAVKEQKVIEMD